MEEEQAYKIKIKLYSDPPPKRRVVFLPPNPLKGELRRRSMRR
jgi:hypothetical protein